MYKLLLTVSLAALPTTSLLLPRPKPATQGPDSAIALKSDRNLLGNGGFETWNQGLTPGGSVGPDMWYAMGNSANAFTQTSIGFTRVSEDPCVGPNGPWAMRATASMGTDFIGQRMENFAEFRGQQVTFAVDFKSTIFTLANPRIEVDDGVTSSFVRVAVTGPDWSRLLVRHTVDACATRLVFKIYPDQTVDANNAMAVLGGLQRADYAPRPNPEPGVFEVPLGAVIDWYRFDAAIPVPEGYAICDGAPISDAGSPFASMPTPNLVDKFVRGVGSVNQIGATGGASSVNLAHDHGMQHTHSGNTATAHIGGGNPPAGFWRILQNPNSPWLLAANEHHYHSFSTGGPSNASTASALGSISILPTYVGLLKIIRIK